MKLLAAFLSRPSSVSFTCCSRFCCCTWTIVALNARISRSLSSMVRFCSIAIAMAESSRRSAKFCTKRDSTRMAARMIRTGQSVHTKSRTHPMLCCTLKHTGVVTMLSQSG